MPENIRALVAVLVLALPVLWLLRPQLTHVATLPADYRLRAGLWVALTLALFLAHSFWLFMLLAAAALLVAGRNDSNPIGLYFFLILLAPPLHAPIQGFAGIAHFLSLDYLRLMSLVVLLPLTLRLLANPASARLFSLPSDKYVLGYVALQLAVTSTATTGTDALRTAVLHVIDIVLPYYAFSRALFGSDRFRDAFAAFTAAGVLLAVIAVFETFKGWLLYASLPAALNVRWEMGTYMLREGALRPSASTGHAIILGYVLTAALGMHLALRRIYPTTRVWVLVLAVLVAGIVASLSRGPWIGAAVLVCVAWAMTPGTASKLTTAALVGVVGAPVLFFTATGQKVLALLPFIGSADESSVTYRQQLFNVSWDILMSNPLLGSPYYMMSASMEQLRQGDGIIDMVNSYLGIAMYSGFIGLFLFAGVFVSSGARLFLHLRRHPDKGDESFAIGLALLATLAAVLVIIATVSSIDAVPVVYWCLAGMCAAYLHWARDEEFAAVGEQVPA